MTVTEAAELPYLSQANFLGQGFDITGTYKLPDSLILPVVDANKATWKEFTFNKTRYSIPSFAEATPVSEDASIEKVASTREELQNSLAVTAKVAVGYGAFSGEMDASYGRDLASSSQHDYAYRNLYARRAVLKMDLREARTMLMKDFVERCEELPATVEEGTLEEFATFFHDYGMYFTSMLTLGGSLEYSVAVNKESNTSLTSIAASLKAEYNGVLFTGELSGSITNTEDWKKYAQNRTVKISLAGGDPGLLAQIENTDVGAPSAATTAAYQQWLTSVGSSPAVADFSLTGIWELIPDKAKRKLVSEAFAELQDSMRPQLQVETNWQPGWPPTISLAGKPTIRPENPPAKQAGYQLVMLDRATLREVRFDKYYSVDKNAPYEEYAKLYDEMAGDIDEGGFDHSGMVMVLVSFGVSFGAPPTLSIYPLLRSFGAGPKLSEWIQKATAGKKMDYRCVYILVGIGALGPRSGVELLHPLATSEIVELEVLFYRQRGVSLYSMSAGKSPAPRKPGVETGASESARHAFLVSGPEQSYVEDLD